MELFKGYGIHFHGILLVVILGLKSTSSIQLESIREHPVDLNAYCIPAEGNTTYANHLHQRPLLLLHDIGQSLDTWDGIQQLLSQKTGRKVCAADLRNHGDSPWSNQSNIAAMTADIDHYLKKENISEVDIIGHGLGGKVAMHYGLNYPKRVHSLIVEDMLPNGFSSSAVIRTRHIVYIIQMVIKDKVPKGSNETEARNIIAFYLKQRLRQVYNCDKISERLAKTLPIRCSEERCEWKTNWKVMGAALGGRTLFWTKSKGEFRKPALFIYGRDSIFSVRFKIEDIKVMFPKVQFVSIANGDHYLHGIYTGFDNAVLNFLKRNRL